MRIFLARMSAVFMLLLATPVAAQSNQVVVELFTSQGCSSCPPADAILGKLAKRDDVIALALHVDYWDYIGWKDIFGDPAYTKRQKAYARAGNRRMIYTPQIVIGGVDDVVGNKPMEVMDAIRAHRALTSEVELLVERNGDRISIAALSSREFSRDLSVQLVRYIPAQSVKITRGENAGRTIDYYNTVSEWRHLRNWDGGSPLNLTLTVQGDDPVVIIVQRANAGAILAAAQVK